MERGAQKLAPGDSDSLWRWFGSGQPKIKTKWKTSNIENLQRIFFGAE
jgi:hypothetical protein